MSKPVKPLTYEPKDGNNPQWSLLTALGLPMSRDTFHEVLKTDAYKDNPNQFDELRRKGMKLGI